jgi:hypothetical protein
MRARTCGLAALALGILIGAGGCTSDSPTSPLVPSAPSAAKAGTTQDDASISTAKGGLLNGGGRQADGTESTTTQAFGGLLNGGG